MEEYVVLVNEQNAPIGTMEKLSAHGANTPLHRGVSVFLLDRKGNLLLQQRSAYKKTWPLIWSNSCCGHPRLDETGEEASLRRLKEELGITDAVLHCILPRYRYRFEKDGIYENEFCPVFVGITDQKPRINAREVASVQWIPWENWLDEVQTHPELYSEWCIEETLLLTQEKVFHRFLQEATKKLPKR